MTWNWSRASGKIVWFILLHLALASQWCNFMQWQMSLNMFLHSSSTNFVNYLCKDIVKWRRSSSRRSDWCCTWTPGAGGWHCRKLLIIIFRCGLKSVTSDCRKAPAAARLLLPEVPRCRSIVCPAAGNRDLEAAGVISWKLQEPTSKAWSWNSNPWWGSSWALGKPPACR